MDPSLTQVLHKLSRERDYFRNVWVQPLERDTPTACGEAQYGSTPPPPPPSTPPHVAVSSDNNTACTEGTGTTEAPPSLETAAEATLLLLERLADLAEHDPQRFSIVMSHGDALETFGASVIPEPWQPLSALCWSAQLELQGHLTAVKSLMAFTDDTFSKGPKAKTVNMALSDRDEQRRYAVLRQELRRLAFTVETDVLPLLNRCVVVFRSGACAPSASESAALDSHPSPSARPPHTWPADAGLVQEFIEVPNVDDEALRRAEVEAIANDMRDVRELQEQMAGLLAQQRESLELAEARSGAALDHASASRVQLTKAAKLRIAGAAFAGAVVGGLLGGPVGLLAGAKSATSVGLIALAGGATGTFVGKSVAEGTVARTTAVDE